MISRASEIDNPKDADGASKSKFYTAFDKTAKTEITFEIFPTDATHATGVYGCLFHKTSPFKNSSQAAPSSTLTRNLASLSLANVSASTIQDNSESSS